MSESTMGQVKPDNLISRHAAIDAIFSEPLYESGMKKRDADVVVPAIYEKIRSLPSAQPEQKWIPCSERLPEEIGSYPVWTARGFGNHLSISYWNGKEWSLRVVAWMPSPEPYEEGERSEE